MTDDRRTYALKFLNKGGVSPARHYAWPLPKNGKPGKWVKATGDLDVCNNGIHAVKFDEGALEWLRAECYVIELDGATFVESERKYVARRGRLVRKVESWDERGQRLFAADCAAHVLPIYEKAFPNDDRPRKAIHAARRYAERPTGKNLDAARAAAWAAWDARDAAWAAWDDRAAARAAVRAAETRWQVERLRCYIDATEAT